MRALRIELRRSVAAGTALLIIAIGGADFIWGGASVSSWATMTFAQRASLLLLWPLAIGVGAWQARRERLAGVGELFASSPRSPAQRLAPVAAALALAVTVAYLLVLLVGTARVWSGPADMYFTIEGGAAAAVGALALVAAAWLGLWLGRLFPSAFAAPVVTMLGVVLVTLLDELDLRASGPAFSLLQPSLDPPPGDQLQLSLGVSAKQGLWLAALAITAFAITTAVSRRGRLLALVPAAVAALIAVPTLPPGGSYMDPSTVYAQYEDALRPVCTPDLPKVCVMRVHSGILDEATGPAREALRALAFLPDPPTSVTEVPEPLGREPAEPEGTDKLAAARTLSMTLYLDRDGHVEDPELQVDLLLEGAGTPGCSTPEQSERYYAAREIVGLWLSQKSAAAVGESPWTEPVRQGLKALTALPAATQRERIAAFRADALRCGDDLYTDLTRGPA